MDKWNTSDEDIATFADKNGLVVVSKDADFRNSHFIKKTPRKIIRICLGNISTQKLIELFSNNMEQLENELQKETVYIEMHDPLVTVFS